MLRRRDDDCVDRRVLEQLQIVVVGAENGGALARPRQKRRSVRMKKFGPWRSLASALAWGARGPEFKSRRPDQITLLQSILRSCPSRKLLSGSLGVGQK